MYLEIIYRSYMSSITVVSLNFKISETDFWKCFRTFMFCTFTDHFIKRQFYILGTKLHHRARHLVFNSCTLRRHLKNQKYV